MLREKFQMDASLPCVEVPKCQQQEHIQPTKVQINLLSSGAVPGVPQTAQTTEICHDADNLKISWLVEQQAVTASLNSKYTTCNSAIFNLDVMEFFIAPQDNLHCYTELDLSMANVPFFSGIQNPNLNHTGITGTPIDCASSGIETATDTSQVQQTGRWTSQLRVPLSLLQCPVGCPAQCTTPTDASVFRVNFYRINVRDASVMQTQKCNDDVCDYLAWSPTSVSPPSFHEPNSFGYMVLV